MHLIKSACTLLLLLLSIPRVLSAQEKKEKINKGDFCGVMVESKADLEYDFQAYLEFLELQENDTIVDIGAGSGWREGALSVLCPLKRLNFILVDIDNDCLNETRVNKMKAHYASLKGAPITYNFQLVHNSKKSLHLPLKTFKKVWILNTLHEIPDQEKMVRDMHDILQPGGEVIILEQVPMKRRQRHEGCRKLLLNLEKQDELFMKNGFRKLNWYEIKTDDGTPIRYTRFLRKR